MTGTDPEKRLIGYACISTYGQMLDTQLSRAHLRRRRRSGIGRLTDPTAAAQLWLRAGSSCPTADMGGRTEEVITMAACPLALSPIRDTLIEGFSHFVTSMTAPIVSGGSEFAGWGLHPLESAALPRRTPKPDFAQRAPLARSAVRMASAHRG